MTMETQRTDERVQAISDLQIRILKQASWNCVFLGVAATVWARVLVSAAEYLPDLVPRRFDAQATFALTSVYRLINLTFFLPLIGWLAGPWLCWMIRRVLALIEGEVARPRMFSVANLWRTYSVFVIVFGCLIAFVACVTASSLLVLEQNKLLPDPGSGNDRTVFLLVHALACLLSPFLCLPLLLAPFIVADRAWPVFEALQLSFRITRLYWRELFTLLGQVGFLIFAMVMFCAPLSVLAAPIGLFLFTTGYHELARQLRAQDAVADVNNAPEMRG